MHSRLNPETLPGKDSLQPLCDASRVAFSFFPPFQLDVSAVHKCPGAPHAAAACGSCVAPAPLPNVALAFKPARRRVAHFTLSLLEGPTPFKGAGFRKPPFRLPHAPGAPHAAVACGSCLTFASLPNVALASLPAPKRRRRAIP